MATVATRSADWVHSNTSRRSARSARSPPTRPSNRVGTIAKNPTSATCHGEPVASKTNQLSSVICIHRAIWVENVANKSRLKPITWKL